jgi:hypothetical protein
MNDYVDPSGDFPNVIYLIIVDRLYHLFVIIHILYIYICMLVYAVCLTFQYKSALIHMCITCVSV